MPKINFKKYFERVLFCLGLFCFMKTWCFQALTILALLASISCSICRNISVSLNLFCNTIHVSWFHFLSKYDHLEMCAFCFGLSECKTVFAKYFLPNLSYIIHLRKDARPYLKGSFFNLNWSGWLKKEAIFSTIINPGAEAVLTSGYYYFSIFAPTDVWQWTLISI